MEAAAAGLDRPTLVRRALLLAAFTVAWNVAEGVVSIGFGVADEAVALLGFGLDSWVEVGSAVVVLWRLRGEGGLGPTLSRDREKRAALVIGGLLLALGVAAGAGGALQLATGGHPDTSMPGVIIAALSLSFMVWLWRTKLALARALDSRTLELDAACSRSCVQLSGVLLAGSLLYVVAPGLWWADAVAAIALAGLIGREGLEGVRAARRPDFQGGCCGGCGKA